MLLLFLTALTSSFHRTSCSCGHPIFVFYFSSILLKVRLYHTWLIFLQIIDKMSLLWLNELCCYIYEIYQIKRIWSKSSCLERPMSCVLLYLHSFLLPILFFQISFTYFVAFLVFFYLQCLYFDMKSLPFFSSIRLFFTCILRP